MWFFNINNSQNMKNKNNLYFLVKSKTSSSKSFFFSQQPVSFCLKSPKIIYNLKKKQFFFLELKLKTFGLGLKKKISTNLNLTKKRFLYKKSYFNIQNSFVLFGSKFYFRKPVLNFEKYFFLQNLNKKKNNNKIKFPFLLNHLAFAQPFIISKVKNTLKNPFFSIIRKGTFKGFYRIFGLKENPKFFLVSRWYRLQRFFSYQKYWKKKEKIRNLFLDCVKTKNFKYNIKNQKNLVVIYHFYFRKRWFLLDIYNM